MSFLRLNSSSRHSHTRLNSSRACMVWNSSTSGPSGVVISMTLGMVLSNRARIGCSGAGLDRADDQTFNR